MLGLKRGVLDLVDYCKQWKMLYRKEEEELRQTLGATIDEIEHVGSTSLEVAGMIAKPILDIALRVNNLKSVESSIDAMAELGYVYRGEQGIAGRHLFAKGDPVTVHLHMMLPWCSNWENQVYFRDYLLEHSEKAAAYVRLKKALLSQSGGDRRAYMDGKGTFIEQMLLEAKALYGKKK